MELSSEQLAEWEAYYLIEPFGQMHLDEIIAQQTAALANTAGMSKRKDKKPFMPDDFFKKPEEIFEELFLKKQRQTVQEAEQLLKSMAVKK